ncbi:sterol O-acyltransferase 2-like [Crotalus adamanteus]|uniref:Sterol O-acyltransferase 2-like n=1 Tax=Crotalus adamanteus TaxID=8729 RepID=A0AAW1C105_CROAD
MFLYTLCVPYQALQIWSGRLKMTRFPNLLTVILVVLVLLCHTAMLGFFPLYILLSCDLGIASCFIVISEQIWFLMKSHSFLRESMPPLLLARDQVGELEALSHDYDGWKISPPELSTYLYFLFCPTLIYRKSYPRPFFLQGLLEFQIMLWILSDIECDWLYYYIYQDILRLFGGRARGGAMLIVFLLSAVVHEYLLTLAFSMFFPVMFVLFTTIGVLLNFVLNDKRKNPLWNIIIWIGLILGTTTVFSLYSQEWFARAHCPLKKKTFWRLFHHSNMNLFRSGGGRGEVLKEKGKGTIFSRAPFVLPGSFSRRAGHQAWQWRFDPLPDPTLR